MNKIIRIIGLLSRMIRALLIDPYVRPARRLSGHLSNPELARN